jgi:hypothetical protein
LIGWGKRGRLSKEDVDAFDEHLKTLNMIKAADEFVKENFKGMF